MDVVIYHNPDCGTSRNVLALIRNAGVEPHVVEYLETPPSRPMLLDLLSRMGIAPRELLRETGTPFHDLGLGDAGLADEALVDAMMAHPILINRPIVVTPRGVRLCRPSEAVLDLLPPQRGAFAKEDGEKVADERGRGIGGSLMSGDVGPIALDLSDTPNILAPAFRPIDTVALRAEPPTHPPRILLLHGSLRPRSFSRLLTLEAERILRAFGAETRVFDPAGLPMPDASGADHPKVTELRDLFLWSEGQVWTSPERHGAMTGVFKCQIDWVPLALGSVRPSQGRTLAVMEVSGGSQSFNTVNQLRVLGRWMRMITIPNQSSVAKAFQEFGDDNRMKPSPYYDRVVDVMEELIKFTLLTRGLSVYLVDRYSERKETAEDLSARVNFRVL